jgi:hypothetical protein
VAQGRHRHCGRGASARSGHARGGRRGDHGSTPFAGGDGGCHFHGDTPVKETVLIDCASKRKDMLIKNGKIDASWAGVKLEQPEMVEFKNKKEWKLTFKNSSEKDAAKQTLYMFYALNGNFLVANFSGK